MPAILFFHPATIPLAKALPPGARWVTVHPNGPGTKGQPLLIQPAGDGSMQVIGGAGGALNFLKLNGVRSEADYKADAVKRDAARKEARKRQQASDREAGLTESKTKAREVLKAAVGDKRAEFVAKVAEAMGWTQDEMRFPEEKYQNASAAAKKKALATHTAALMKKAKQAVDLQRQALLADAEARSSAGLGEVPLTTPAEKPEMLTVQDLDPIAPATKGLGFATEYGKRAEKAGLTAADLAQEAASFKPAPKNPPKPGEPSAAQQRKEKGEAIAGELAAIRDPGPQVDAKQVVDAKKAVALLQAAKALATTERQARDHGKAIDKATEEVEPKAYVLEVGKAAVEADTVKGLENDLRTLRTRAFLEEVGKQAGGLDSLGKHIGVGAYNSVNAVALAAGGAALVDRSVVDVLGVAGASQVLARRLQTDLTGEEMDQLRQAMGAYHVDHYMAASEKALRDAREWQELAHSIEVGEAANGAELSVAQEMNAKRRDAVENAQRILGTTLGEMEANAALVVALDAPKKDSLQLSLGSISVEDAIRQARAIGLERGDYQVERVGSSTFISVTGAGMDRLAKPVSREDMAHVQGAMDIINGRKDEDGWLPEGVADRPDMVMQVKPGTAPRLAEPFPANPADLGKAIRDYIGGRAADGDAPADIMAGLLSEDTLQLAGDRQAFMDELAKVAPIYDADGKMIRAEAHADAFDKLADEYVAGKGGERSPLHRQKFEVDDTSNDALHRALAEHPEGGVAWKPVGELTPQDQGALRTAFAAEYARTNPEAERLQGEVAALDKAEPAKESQGLFGPETNPEWSDWKAKRDAAAEAANGATMSWGKYLDVMRTPQRAYAAMQDVIRSKVLRSFADHHNRLRPAAPLAIGRTAVANDLDHLDALDPEARERRVSAHRDLVDRLRNRVAGKYSAGGVTEKLAAARAAEEAASQAQMGLFGAEPEPPKAKDAAPEPEKPLELGRRFTIGHAAERQVAGMMPIIGPNFKPGQPVKLWRPDMSGKYVGRQRAVKLIEHNRRCALAMGTGSGKTSISLAAFTHLHAKGKATRGLFVVPSVVQGQFHGEALTMLKPGQFKWHCNPGASRDERIAALKDPTNHFNVVTHQSFRDDMLHLASQREGTTSEAVAEKLDGMTPAARKDYMRDLLAAEGIGHNMLAIDEGHNLLNREGKDNSRMANVIDAVAHNMPTYVNMTADPVKNDVSELFDLFQKMDPDRYSDRAAFMRKYGVNTGASRDELKREMARYFYTTKIDPGVKANRQEIKVPLDDAQRGNLATIDKAAASARLARMKGGVDLAALKTLSPNSFADVPEAQHQQVAAQLNRSLGIIHNTAVLQAMSGKGKTDAVARIAGERKGRQGVVFVHHLAKVDEVAARLKADGHRVVTMSGADSSQAKDDIKRAYQAGKHDILVVSDAGAVGANLQKGKWLVQYDTPPTAMLHAQRGARIHRVGQTEDVELFDLMADHPAERKARERLATKYELRDIVTSPLEGLDDTGLAGYLGRVKAGKAEAARPLFAPAGAEDVPPGLAEPEAQQSMF